MTIHNAAWTRCAHDKEVSIRSPLNAHTNCSLTKSLISNSQAAYEEHAPFTWSALTGSLPKGKICTTCLCFAYLITLSCLLWPVACSRPVAKNVLEHFRLMGSPCCQPSKNFLRATYMPRKDLYHLYGQLWLKHNIFRLSSCYRDFSHCCCGSLTLQHVSVFFLFVCFKPNWSWQMVSQLFLIYLEGLFSHCCL